MATNPGFGTLEDNVIFHVKASNTVYMQMHDPITANTNRTNTNRTNTNRRSQHKKFSWCALPDLA